MYDSDDHVLEYVDSYLHDALPPASRKRVAMHCRECPICKVALDEAQKRLELLQAMPAIEAPESLIRATEQRIARFRPPRFTPLRVAVALAASIVLLLGGATLYYTSLAAPPIDLRVLGQSELFAGADASLRLLLQNPRSGVALAGVPIDIDLLAEANHPATRLASLVTNEFGSGSVRMRMPDWTPGKYRLSIRAHSGGPGAAVVEPITLRRSWQLILTSDKPVYRPGDTIRLRSLALAQPFHKPVAGESIEFSVTDAKGNVIFRKRDVTSRFGIASIDCPLATEINEGAYQLQAKIGDTASELTVVVKQYVLPKFKIDVALNHPFYRPGERVRGTVSAHYFFGRPVRDGRLEIAAALAGFAAADVARIAAHTDTAGDAKFEFVLPASLAGKPDGSTDAHFDLNVRLIDSAGQLQSTTASAIVTVQPIRIEVVPESGRLVPGLKNTIYFLTSYADGRPARTRLAIGGIDHEIATDDLGAASIEFTPQNGSTNWLIRATDDAGQIGRREIALESGQFAAPFLVRTDRAVYDGGQTVHITAICTGDSPLFVDVIKDGQTMLTAAIPVAKGQGAYDLDLPPECSGALQLCAYRFANDVNPAIQNRIIYVRQASALKVAARLDRGEYRPGERARLSVSVTDAEGKPAPAAVSLAAVDEAVGSVLGRTSGLAPVLSAFETRLLKPLYAIYPRPDDLDRAAPAGERNRFEQALFARATAGQDNRDAFLQELVRQYADNSQILLEVLKRPDWEQLVRNMPDMEKYIPLLRGDGSTYTLRDSSYRDTSRSVEALRSERLEQIGGIWIALAAIAVIGGLIWLLTHVHGAGVVLLLILVFGVLASLLLPAVQSAREAAPLAQATNDLRQLGFALQNREDAMKHMPAADSTAAETPQPRVRSWFPETLLWRPELVTDDNGRATLDIDLADSITTWRLTASAVSADGFLGGAEQPIRVFQPFFVDLNLPVGLTRGDEVAVPAVVYNYSDKPLSVELELADAPWFTRLDSPKQRLDLAVNEVRSVSFRIRANKVGRHELTVRASAAGVADAIRRPVDVTPDGRRVEQNSSGTLERPAAIPWSIPADATEGSVRATVKIHPSTFSQVVDGMEGIFQMPSGCFEQTSSTTYPNVLALNYLRQTKQSAPAIEATAQRDIHLGYQRLLSFEIPGGGFDWFGHPPANRTLTAYGLMEFSDMARVHEVDPKLIERTRHWLLRQQQPDGSWSPEGRPMEEDPAHGVEGLSRLSTTAYIAWAVFAGSTHDSDAAQRAMDYLRSWDPAKIDDPYVSALVANALLAIDGSPTAAAPYVARLQQQCRRSDDGKLAWWELPGGMRTTFFGAGNCGNVETTALATLALLHSGADPGTVRAALAWLVRQKDGSGTWGSTQATVLALKALLAGTGEPLGDGQPRRIEIRLDDKPIRTLDIAPEQSDVVQQIDLSRFLAAGTHQLAIHRLAGSACGYDASLVHYLPSAKTEHSAGPLSISLDYDKTKLSLSDSIEATARVTNRTKTAMPMVIAELPIPPGLSLDDTAFASVQAAGKIAKYQLSPRRATLYLRELSADEPFQVKYRLHAATPLAVTAPAATAYEYYDPSQQASSTPVRLEVNTAP